MINQTAVSPSLLRTWLKLQNVILLVLIPPRPPSRDCCSAQGNEKCCKNSELLSEWGNNLEEKLHVKIQLLEKCTHYQFELLCHADVRLFQFSSWHRLLHSSIQGLNQVTTIHLVHLISSNYLIWSPFFKFIVFLNIFLYLDPKLNDIFSLNKDLCYLFIMISITFSNSNNLHKHSALVCLIYFADTEVD